MDAYLNVRNLMNSDPALVAQGPGGVAFSTPPSNPRYYDSLGRMFRAGIRFRMYRPFGDAESEAIVPPTSLTKPSLSAPPQCV